MMLQGAPLTALNLDAVAGDQLDLLGVLGRHGDDVVMGIGGCGRVISWYDCRGVVAIRCLRE